MLSGKLDTRRDRDELVREARARIGHGIRDVDASSLTLTDRRERAGLLYQTIVAAFPDHPSVITMGADLLAMAAACQLITGVRYIYWVVPLAGLMAVVTIFLDYNTVKRYLLWLVAFLAAYVVAAALARPEDQRPPQHAGAAGELDC